MKEQGSFTYKTEKYFGSKYNIHTVSWKGKGEVDGDEIRQWCNENFGPSGYLEEYDGTRWLDNISEQGEIMLCRDEDLTFFLLKFA